MTYPLLVNLEGMQCVVVGAGVVAERRIKGLEGQGAEIRVVAPEATPALIRKAQDGEIVWLQESYSSAHLDEAFLVIAATESSDVNGIVTRDAKARNILVCRVDESSDGNYITPAVIERGELTIALSTGGSSPTLAAVLKSRLARQFGAEWVHWIKLFGALRAEVKNTGSELDRRTTVERLLNDIEIQELIRVGRVVEAEEKARQCILSHLE